jgi:hypothetical protein
MDVDDPADAVLRVATQLDFVVLSVSVVPGVATCQVLFFISCPRLQCFLSKPSNQGS